MKLKFFFLGMICLLTCGTALAQQSPQRGISKDAGLHYIQSRGYIRCGTDLSTKTYAIKDENGDWKGIDADLCRMMSLAIFGDSRHFKLVNVQTPNISQALARGDIDIMFGNHALSAKFEALSQANAADLVYYDREMFMANHKPGAKSMEAYRGSNVCVVGDGETAAAVQEYNRRYNLELKIMPLPSLAKAKEAFYLKRCQLLAANEIYLRGLAASVISRNTKPVVLPEVIGLRPNYAYTSRSNNQLRIISKWIINALRLAEAEGINKSNVDIMIGVTSRSLRNLLGDDPKLWEVLGLQPNWVRQALSEIGNFGEIYERNLGAESELKITRDKNRLIKNGGLIPAMPFL